MSIVISPSSRFGKLLRIYCVASKASLRRFSRSTSEGIVKRALDYRIDLISTKSYLPVNLVSEGSGTPTELISEMSFSLVAGIMLNSQLVCGDRMRVNIERSRDLPQSAFDSTKP